MKKGGFLVIVKTPVGDFRFLFDSRKAAEMAYIHNFLVSDGAFLPSGEPPAIESRLLAQMYLDAQGFVLYAENVDFIQRALFFFTRNKKETGFVKMLRVKDIFDKPQWQSFRQSIEAGFVGYCENNIKGFSQKKNFICPFHAENTPSACFYPSGKGGVGFMRVKCWHSSPGTYDFPALVMAREKVDFEQAIEVCAAYAGVVNPFQKVFLFNKFLNTLQSF